MKIQDAAIRTVQALAILTQLRFVGLAVLLLSVAGLHAQETYCYTGNYFTSATPQYTTSDSISGCVTLSSALPPNQGFTNVNSEVIAFAFTDGLYVIPQNDPTVSSYVFEFETSGGVITQWNIVFFENDNCVFQSASTMGSDGLVSTDNTAWEPPCGYHSAGNANNPGTWSIGSGGSIGNGIDISYSAGVFSDQVWQKMVNAGIKFAVVQAWGGRSYNDYAEAQLLGAQRNGLATAAYVLLNYDDPSEDGAYQVEQGLAATGSARDNLRFLVIDVEPFGGEKLPPSKFRDRIAEIRKAVSTVIGEGLKPVIYTDRGGWAQVTKGPGHGNGCGRNPVNDCSDLIGLPLWDTEHIPCGDGIIGLRSFSQFPRASGWHSRRGNQYDTGPGPGCNGASLFGIPVDLDFFDPSLF